MPTELYSRLIYESPNTTILVTETDRLSGSQLWKGTELFENRQQFSLVQTPTGGTKTEGKQNRNLFGN